MLFYPVHGWPAGNFLAGAKASLASLANAIYLANADTGRRYFFHFIALALRYLKSRLRSRTVALIFF